MEHAGTTDLTTAELREAVAAILHGVASRLPDGCARVDVQETAEAEGVWRCVFRPTGSGEGCAEVVLEIPEAAEVIYVGFGVDSRVEVTASGDGWRDERFESHLDQVEAIVLAVASGHVSETTWTRGGVILKSRAVLGLADGPYAVTARHTLVPLWGSSRTTARFRQYCEQD